MIPKLWSEHHECSKKDANVVFFGVQTLLLFLQRVYRALYDYAAQDHDEVSFRDGDVIINAQPIDEGWMYGTVQRTGKSGMLPANYVESYN